MGICFYIKLGIRLHSSANLHVKGNYLVLSTSESYYSANQKVRQDGATGAASRPQSTLANIAKTVSPAHKLSEYKVIYYDKTSPVQPRKNVR